MKTTLRTEFINEDRTVDTERAIEAGHDASTAAIKEFAAWLVQLPEQHWRRLPTGQI